MRRLMLLAVLAVTLTPSLAEGRLFWQTYGATVAAPGGCAWNINQDYFVPRHCDSGRYGLFSACKTAHSISPACKNVHPIYDGYCTPYGKWHYDRRDHVYKTHCGCTPLAGKCGPWRLEECGKHCPLFHHGSSRRGCFEGAGCFDGAVCPEVTGELAASVASSGNATVCNGDCLCNVEPFGGEVLGQITAYPMGSASGGGAAAMAGGGAAAMGAGGAMARPQGQSILPTMGVGAPPAAGISLPAGRTF